MVRNTHIHYKNRCPLQRGPGTNFFHIHISGVMLYPVCWDNIRNQSPQSWFHVLLHTSEMQILFHNSVFFNRKFLSLQTTIKDSQDTGCPTLTRPSFADCSQPHKACHYQLGQYYCEISRPAFKKPFYWMEQNKDRPKRPNRKTQTRLAAVWYDLPL